MLFLKHPISLQGKIIVSYSLMAGMILILGLGAYFELKYTKSRVQQGYVLSKLLEYSLEIRRYEKNFFLYKKQADIEISNKYVVEVQKILKHNRSLSVDIIGKRRTHEFETSLEKYHNLLNYIIENKNLVSKKQKAEVRKLGKQMILTVENINRMEYASFHKGYALSFRVYMASILIILLTGFYIILRLSRTVIGSLSTVEKNMNKFVKTGYHKLDLNIQEREIVSLQNAFNRMIVSLDRNKKRLVQSEKLAALGTLLSGIAHELNNPISNISLTCQVLLSELDDKNRDSFDEKEIKSSLKMIDDETIRARNIIKTLLDYSRDKPSQKVCINLASLISEVLVLCRASGKSKNIDYLINIDPDIKTYADKQRLQMVCMNLLLNSQDAIEKQGKINIQAKIIEEDSVNTHEEVEGELLLELSFRDDGAGIPGENLDRIFDPFFSTKMTGDGTGLGLFITHEIIAEESGTIEVESEEGKYTEFTVRFPLCQVPVEIEE